MKARLLTEGQEALFMRSESIYETEVWRMTSQLLTVLPLVGIAAGLLWLGALWGEPYDRMVGQGRDYETDVQTERDHPMEAEAR